MSKIVRGHGPLDASIVLLGEAPAVEELKHGKPFVGKSGAELDHYCLPAAKITRDMCRIENVFEWMIPLDPRMKETYLAANFDKQQADTLHRLSKCESSLVIVALGVTALRCLDINKSMEMAHGIPHRLERNHILNKDRDQEVIVMPCYHPAAGLRQPERIRNIKYDFEQLGELLWGECEIYPKKHTEPSYAIFTNQPIVNTGVIAIDCEWLVDDSTWCFTVSTEPHKAFLVWPEDIHKWKQCVESSLVVYWNALADKKRLEDCGVFPVLEIDGMIMSYHLEIAQGLKVASYRSCDIEQTSYRDVVKDVEDKMAIEYLETMADVEWPDPEPFLAWNNDPKKERLYTYYMTECTKRKKGSYEKNGKWYYDKKVFDGYKIVAGTENGHDYMRQPQNIGKMAAGALKRGSDPVKTLNKWKADERLIQCDNAIGKWLGADLSMIDLDKAVQYACADADATLQVAHKLYKLYIQSGIPYPDWIKPLEYI